MKVIAKVRNVFLKPKVFDPQNTFGGVHVFGDDCMEVVLVIQEAFLVRDIGRAVVTACMSSIKQQRRH